MTYKRHYCHQEQEAEGITIMLTSLTHYPPLGAFGKLWNKFLVVKTFAWESLGWHCYKKDVAVAQIAPLEGLTYASLHINCTLIAVAAIFKMILKKVSFDKIVCKSVD